MAPLLSIEVDSTALIEAMMRSPELIEQHCKPAAKIAAENIAREWRARFARRQEGPTRGAHAVTGIKVEESRDGKGYVVFLEWPDMPNIGLWLEFGTSKMLPHPPGGSLFPSIRLEEGAHDRRMRDAIQAGIDESGLGGG